MKIKEIKARQILDSRGNPTVEADVLLSDGSSGRASVPSGASTGAHEAVELRDKDETRYDGKSVQKAVKNINTLISQALEDKDATQQKEIDGIMTDLDGTENKSRLGANAILAVSLANAKAAALSQNLPLYTWLSVLEDSSGTPAMPTPAFNIMNGGAHADNNLSIQEFMVVPNGIEGFPEQLHAGVMIQKTLKGLLKKRNLDTTVGDEGGFAPSFEPNLNDDEDALELISEAIEKAGYRLGGQIMLALDIAISQYYDPKTKIYDIPHQRKGDIKGGADVVINYIETLITKYPFVSIEDGLHEDDWESWPMLSATLMEHNVLCVGDDFTVTNPKRLSKAIDSSAISALIVKPNQVGSLSEVMQVLKMCEENMIIPIISHRSGDTVDSFIADLAYASGAKYIKTGAPTRAERVEKYNQLLRIYEETQE